MPTTYQVFEGRFRCGTRLVADHFYVAAENPETGRLTALATWPEIEEITHVRSFTDLEPA